MANKLSASGEIQDKDRYISVKESKKQMVAMLTEIQLEIEEKSKETPLDDYDCGYNTGVYVSNEVIQEKINSLKEDA